MAQIIPGNNTLPSNIKPQYSPPPMVSVLGFFCSFTRPTLNWFKRSRCPKCGGWKCMQYHSEIVKDKVAGHSRSRYGRYRDWYGRTNDDPFIREWVEERYICQNCGKHVSIEITRDRY